MPSPKEPVLRASMEELFEFANKVRAAGGGNPIDALMPAVPEDQSQCLIAKNLNFNCAVNGEGSGWSMAVADEAIRDRIASALNLEPTNSGHDGTDAEGNDCYMEYGVMLPRKIGQVAADFDRAGGIYQALSLGVNSPSDYDQEDLAMAYEMAPYIEAATDEAYDLATVINPDGSIVI